jgi:hypothetical protein
LRNALVGAAAGDYVRGDTLALFAEIENASKSVVKST